MTKTKGLPRPLTHYAWLSIATAIATIGLKGVAWKMTGSVGLLSGVVCGRGRNPTLRLWPTIFSGKIDVFPGDRRSRLISSMTSVAPA
ncbi:hypothetical protein I4B27_004813 [Enterobacter hormaechei]|nr:hypothetical protein [Enterobacter hormaechei]EGQ5288355.1 hypothetical protein [Enterobacter hormaechei]